MLEIRPNCENCGKQLPYNSTEAMICSFECTFCNECVQNVLRNVCPNCGGGFERRPVRPKEKLEKNPVSTRVVKKVVNKSSYNELLLKYEKIPPEER